MRISLLSCNLSDLKSGDPDGHTGDLARYVAQENVSCLLLQGCTQLCSDGLSDQPPTIADTNIALRLQQSLEAIGIRYELVWYGTRTLDGTQAIGCAILSQLPVLEQTADPMMKQGTVPCSTTVARLALGPNTSFDAYCAVFGAGQTSVSDDVDRLAAFVDQTPELLAEQRPPKPRKRGPVRRKRPTEDDVVQSRVICIGASVQKSGTFETGDLDELAAAHYLDLTASIREKDPTVGTTPEGWKDFLFVKPAVRPLSARLVFSGDPQPLLGSHAAVLAEIEL